VTDQQSSDLQDQLATVIARAGVDYRPVAQDIARAVLGSDLVVPLAPLRVWIARQQAERFCNKDHADELEDYIDCIQTGRDYDWEE
jgi:hypothetical protein